MTVLPCLREAESPRRHLHTSRLMMHASAPALAEAVIDYQRRNAGHFAPWDPVRPAGYWELEPTRARLAEEEVAFSAGTAWHYWIQPVDQPGRIVGHCALSSVARGVFQNAMLGYGLDHALVGGGWMQEALRCLLDEVFGPVVSLHRVQASVRPENERSRRVLERLGFRREGFSPCYLYIAGAWRDHETFALLNPFWDRHQRSAG